MRCKALFSVAGERAAKSLSRTGADFQVKPHQGSMVLSAYSANAQRAQNRLHADEASQQPPRERRRRRHNDSL
jgi:hypothetical protein